MPYPKLFDLFHANLLIEKLHRSLTVGPAHVLVNRIDAMHLSDRPESVRGNRLPPPKLTILTIGLTCPLDDVLSESFRIVEAANAEVALRQLARDEIAVLVVGSRLTPAEALSMLTQHCSNSPNTSTVTVVLCAGSDPELFQQLVNEGHVFYMARAELTAGQLRSIVVCAAARFQSRLKESQDPWAAQVGRIDQLLEFCIRIPMQTSLRSAAALLIETARELLNAELVQYLAYDPEDETLTPADAVDHKEWCESAAAGLAAYVARTGERIQLDCVGQDSRYDAETDNPGGAEDARFLAEPVIGPKSVPVGVITVTRTGRSTPFSHEDSHLLELLAECAAPTLNQILLQSRVQALLIRRTEGSNSDVFREEALEYHIRSWDRQGDVLKTLPPWLRTTYWVMIALVFVSLLGLATAKFNVYASGPAVIRARAAMKVTATDGGRIRSVTVSPGDTVKVGDVLVVVDSISPSRTDARSTKSLSAPANGIVGEIFVHPGQSLMAGDQVMTVVEPDAGYDLIAFLPESYAAQLHQGMAVRLRMAGESSSRRALPISRVGPGILDASEAARYAGQNDAAKFPVFSRVVAVRASLPVANSGGSSSEYRDGATGEAEISVRSESAIVALIPGLRKIFGKAE